MPMPVIIAFVIGAIALGTAAIGATFSEPASQCEPSKWVYMLHG